VLMSVPMSVPVPMPVALTAAVSVGGAHGRAPFAVLLVLVAAPYVICASTHIRK